MTDELRALIDMIDAASNQRMIKVALKNFAFTCGFNRFAFMQTEGATVKTLNNYPQDWQELYLGQRYSRVDPVVTEGRRSPGFFAWTASGWSGSRTSHLRSFRDQAIEHGIRSGVTIAVEGSFGTRLMLTFASAAADIRHVATFDPQKSQQAVLAVHYRLRAFSDATVLEPKKALSPRELVCLTWAAKGKGAPDIAAVTNINQRTVQHYLDNARRKLDAATIGQLIAIAKDQKIV